MVNKKVFALFVVIVMTSLIGDLVYRVFIRPQGWPYDLLVVMVAIAIPGLCILAPELVKNRKEGRLVVWLIPALLLGGLAGSATQVAYDYLSSGVIRWERHLSNLENMLAAFVVFLVIVLVVVGIVQARSKGKNSAE